MLELREPLIERVLFVVSGCQIGKVLLQWALVEMLSYYHIALLHSLDTPDLHFDL